MEMLKRCRRQGHCCLIPVCLKGLHLGLSWEMAVVWLELALALALELMLLL